jgi:Brp/Blh family beta-carotene 15,15'-monooxygenase
LFNAFKHLLNEVTKKNDTFNKINNLNTDYQDFMIFFTFLLLWISIQFGQIIEDSIAYVIVLSLGIIHGANDLSILKKKEYNTSNFTRHIAIYLLLILCCVVSYLLYPFVSIILFIILSSYHFGEQHLGKKITGINSYKMIVYIFYGLLIFCMIFIQNMKDVDSILINLTNLTIPKLWIQGALITAGSFLILSFTYHFFIKKERNIDVLREVFYFLLLFLVFKTSSLILGFAIYFVLWHSVPSILDQTKYLLGVSSKKTILRYFKKAFIYWLLSIIALALTYYFVDVHYFNSIVFLTLFSVTAPHVWVMYRMNITSNE